MVTFHYWAWVTFKNILIQSAFYNCKVIGKNTMTKIHFSHYKSLKDSVVQQRLRNWKSFVKCVTEH